MLLKLLQNAEEQETFANSFSEASVALISKSDKDTKGKENYRTMSLVNIDAEILNKMLANQILQHVKGIIDHDQWGFIPRMQGCFSVGNSTNNNTSR